MNKQELFNKLWSCADILRNTMDANEYKNYLLGLVFYKYLSDELLLRVADENGVNTNDLNEALEIYNDIFNSEDGAEFSDYLKSELGYALDPKYTFTNLMKNIISGEFDLSDLQAGFQQVETSNELFVDLFEDIDLYSKKLGNNPNKQNKTISEMMKQLSELDFVNSEGDILGDAYEYLISQFASESGKKAGEFYTPHAVSDLMSRIAILGKEDKQGLTLYDPTMGSGSLLLNMAKYSNYPKDIKYFGRELNNSTYNLARMNMILHKVRPNNQKLSNGDSLDTDWPVDEPTQFDAVLMNPPYSAKWDPTNAGDDPRYDRGLAPKSKADYAFLLNGLYHLQEQGTMAIVLPHGVLFRGASEGKIRTKLLDEGLIYAVIGLPANIFFNTSIPTCVLILKKKREGNDVLFIDASKEFEKQKAQNVMNEEHIQKILDTYKKREDVDKFAHVATLDEIKENDYNLNIPRYVDTFEEEEEIDIKEVMREIKELEAKRDELDKEINVYLKELGILED